MVAMGYLPEPGSEYAPCEECEHSDCAVGRRMYACVCRFCGEAIGTRGFFDEYKPGQELRWGYLVHGVCKMEDLERQEASAG